MFINILYHCSIITIYILLYYYIFISFYIIICPYFIRLNVGKAVESKLQHLVKWCTMSVFLHRSTDCLVHMPSVGAGSFWVRAWGNLGIIPGLFENRPLSVFVHLRYSNLHRITKIQNDPNVEISSSVLIKSRTPGSKAWLGRGDFHCAFMAFGNLARRRGLKPAGSYGVAGHAYPLHPLTNNHAKWIIMNYSKCNLNNHQKSPK